MTPQLLKTLAFSAFFSTSPTGLESAEPLPTDAPVVDIDLDDDAARKKKKANRSRQRAQRSRTRSKVNRSSNQQRQQRSEVRTQPQRQPQQRSERRSEQRAERRAEQRAEQRSEQRAERRAEQRAEQRSEQRAERRAEERADRRAEQRAERRAEERAEAARRTARHRSAAQKRQRAERRAEERAEAARRTARHRRATTRHRPKAAGRARGHGHHGHRPHSRPHRWHHRWSHNHNHRHVRWYHGVFVYGPSPYRHHRVRRGVYQEQDQSVPLPSRKLDRQGAFSVGLTTGSYMSGYGLGGEFSDFGLGVNARLRPVEGLGFELGYSVHDQNFESDTQRTTTILQPSVQVFAAPWSRVSPYASVGVTFAERAYNDTWSDGYDEYTSVVNDESFGPHAGIGLEIAIGENAAIDFEARAIGYLDNQEGGTVPGAVQTTFGAQWYF